MNRLIMQAEIITGGLGDMKFSFFLGLKNINNFHFVTIIKFVWIDKSPDG